MSGPVHAEVVLQKGAPQPVRLYVGGELYLFTAADARVLGGALHQAATAAGRDEEKRAMGEGGKA